MPLLFHYTVIHFGWKLIYTWMDSPIAFILTEMG